MQYYLKDKTLDIYEGTNTRVNGVTKTTYSLLKGGVFAYYKQQAGGSTITGSAIKVFDSTERATFVINRMPILRQKPLSLLKVKFNKRVYDIKLIDDYEGYTDDYKLTCEYSSKQQYDGIPVDN